MNRPARTLLRAGGGRLVVSPDRVVLLRKLGDRHVVEYDRAAVRMIEHAFTTHVGHDLDLLHEIDAALPRLMFRDFLPGYLRFLCAEVLLRRGRPYPSPSTRSTTSQLSM